MKLSLENILGIELSPTSHAEKLISGTGSFVAIYAIYYVSEQILGSDALAIVLSMGASAVLLFAVPHGQLSQPWPLFAGNMISAVIGVICAKYIPDLYYASAVAVGASVAVMHYAKCIHPPGGATALTAVVGGTSVTDLGFMYVLSPVLLNIFIIFIAAILFNYLFTWRRYPAFLSGKEVHEAWPENKRMLSHEAIEYAFKQMDTFVDISEKDLNQIVEMATAYDENKKGSLRK